MITKFQIGLGMMLMPIVTLLMTFLIFTQWIGLLIFLVVLFVFGWIALAVWLMDESNYDTKEKRVN